MILDYRFHSRTLELVPKMTITNAHGEGDEDKDELGFAMQRIQFSQNRLDHAILLSFDWYCRSLKEVTDEKYELLVS